MLIIIDRREFQLLYVSCIDSIIVQRTVLLSSIIVCSNDTVCIDTCLFYLRTALSFILLNVIVLRPQNVIFPIKLLPKRIAQQEEQEHFVVY